MNSGSTVDRKPRVKNSGFLSALVRKSLDSFFTTRTIFPTSRTSPPGAAVHHVRALAKVALLHTKIASGKSCASSRRANQAARDKRFRRLRLTQAQLRGCLKVKDSLPATDPFFGARKRKQLNQGQLGRAKPCFSWEGPPNPRSYPTERKRGTVH